jgi:glycosyltransferase involved in cell wall biosynthesis
MLVEHIQGIFSPEHGGPTLSLRNFAIGQTQRGAKVRVRVLEGYPNTSAALRLPSSIDQMIFPVEFPRVSGRSAPMKRFLRQETDPDVYHLHGSWLFAMKYGIEEALRRRRPHVVAMMGSYQPEELARKPWRKRLFRAWFQDRLLRQAACIHVNSVMEAEQLRDLGFKRPLAPIPVGFDTQAADENEAKVSEHTPAFAANWEKNERFVLFLARVHPNKGIELLVDAWKELALEHGDVRLVVAGPITPAYRAALVQRMQAWPVSSRPELLGYIDELTKAWLYKHAAVYCLPSYSENYGATIQDALGHGVPVITTRHTPWRNLEAQRVGWLTETTASAVAERLREALSLSPAERAAMAQKARAWVRAEYSLATVIEMQLDLYRWMRGGSIPGFVLAE